VRLDRGVRVKFDAVLYAGRAMGITNAALYGFGMAEMAQHSKGGHFRLGGCRDSKR
jgi:hypothetical protein